MARRYFGYDVAGWDALPYTHRAIYLAGNELLGWSRGEAAVFDTEPEDDVIEDMGQLSRMGLSTRTV